MSGGFIIIKETQKRFFLSHAKIYFFIFLLEVRASEFLYLYALRINFIVRTSELSCLLMYFIFLSLIIDFF